MPLVGFAVIIAIFLFISSKSKDKISIFIALGLLALYSAALVYGFLNTPYSYQFSNELLMINRRRSPLKIPLKDIQVVRDFNKDDRKGLVKTFGAEGVIGNILNVHPIALDVIVLDWSFSPAITPPAAKNKSDHSAVANPKEAPLTSSGLIEVAAVGEPNKA